MKHKQYQYETGYPESYNYTIALVVVQNRCSKYNTNNNNIDKNVGQTNNKSS